MTKTINIKLQSIICLRNAKNCCIPSGKINIGLFIGLFTNCFNLCIRRERERERERGGGRKRREREGRVRQGEVQYIYTSSA